jgi:hypothetical protein
VLRFTAFRSVFSSSLRLPRANVALATSTTVIAAAAHTSTIPLICLCMLGSLYVLSITDSLIELHAAIRVMVRMKVPCNIGL